MSRLSATATYTARDDGGRFIKMRVTPEVIERVTRCCEVVVGHAKSIVRVRTGFLRDSINSRVDEVGNRVIGTVYADAEYAGYVEMGTGARGAASAGAGPYPYTMDWPGMEASPFLRPALDTGRQEVLGIWTGEPLLTE